MGPGPLKGLTPKGNPFFPQGEFSLERMESADASPTPQPQHREGKGAQRVDQFLENLHYIKRLLLDLMSIKALLLVRQTGTVERSFASDTKINWMKFFPIMEIKKEAQGIFQSPAGKAPHKALGEKSQLIPRCHRLYE